MDGKLVLTYEEVKLLAKGAKADSRKDLYEKLIRSNTAAGTSILYLNASQAEELYRVAKNVLMKEGLDYSDRPNQIGLIMEGIIKRLGH